MSLYVTLVLMGSKCLVLQSVRRFLCGMAGPRFTANEGCTFRIDVNRFLSQADASVYSCRRPVATDAVLDFSPWHPSKLTISAWKPIPEILPG